LTRSLTFIAELLDRSRPLPPQSHEFARVEFPRAPGLHIGVIFYELQAPLNEHSKIGKPNGVIGEHTIFCERRSC
jgi:hypothetical protein